MSSRIRFSLLLLAIASSLHAQLSRFSGIWENVDPNTRGVTKLDIRAKVQEVTVQAWGKCHPEDCDWGQVNGYAYASGVSSSLIDSAQALSAIFQTTFSQTLIIVHAVENRLRAEVLTRFTDRSGRMNYRAFYTFTQAAPPLTGETIDQFIDWASRSDSVGHLKAREEILKKRQDPAMISLLFDRLDRARTNDLGTSLVILGIIGEMKNPAWLDRFATLLDEPLPDEEEVRDGGLNKRDMVEMLNAKAVECVAYLRTTASDSLTLWVVQHHPSVAVRAAAVDAYLWNHGDSTEARERLKPLLSQAELPFLDRVRQTSAGSRDAFNAGLERFYELHPGQIAPVPETINRSRRTEDEPGKTSNWIPFILLGALVLVLVLIFILIKKTGRI